MSIRKATRLHNLSLTTVARCKKDITLEPANRSPRKIGADILRQGVNYPDAYAYERSARVGCSKSGIEVVMTQLGYTGKKAPSVT